MPAAEADRPGKVFVGGLASDIDEAVLEKYFSHFGRLTEVIVKRDKNTQQTRGYAFITFENPYDAEDAIKEMDKKDIHGRQIYVEQAVKPRHETQNLRMPPRGGGSRGMSRGGRGGGSGRGGGGSRGGPRGGRGDGHMDMRSRSPIRQRPDRGRSDREFRRDSFDGPQRRDFGGDRYGGMDRGMDRGPPQRSRDPPMSRGRDHYSPGPRDFGRSSGPDRMSRGSGRDFQQSSRYESSLRDFTPPPREFQSSRDIGYERALTSRDRVSARDYGSPTSSRDFGGMSRSGSSMYGGSREAGMGGRDVYSGGRDRDQPQSRDFSSREFSSRGGSMRGVQSRGGSDYDRGQSHEDSFRDSGRSGPSSRGPASRVFSSMGSQRDSGRPSHGMYESSNRGPSRGGMSSNRGPPARGGPPQRDDRDRVGYSTGQRRPSNMDSRGGPPMKRSRPSGPPSRGSMRR